MSLVIDKQTRDLINELNKTKQDILKIKASINKILNKSTSLVATGSFGQEASNSHAALEGVQGSGPIHLSSNEITHLDFFNSTFAEQFDFKITSNGTVITGSLEKTNTGDLTMQFANSEYVVLDCTPAKTITITAGTDIAPVLRYYYVLQSAQTIITEGLSWPSAEHIKVARINVPSAAFIQTKNVYSNQNINNMNSLVAGDLSGMLVHLGHKIRESVGATYNSGLAGAAGAGEYLDVSGGTTVRFKMDAGVIIQMHHHAFNAVDTSASSVVLVRNFSGTNWNDISNIYDIVNDSLGATINNKYFNLMCIAIASKETDYVMINVPSGSYNTLANATEDKDMFDDLTIPLEFRGVATLICRMTIRKAASAWVVHQIDDLRGITPSSISGSTISGGYSDVDAIAAVEAEATLVLSGTITNPASNKGYATGTTGQFSMKHNGTNAFLLETSGSLFIGVTAANQDIFFDIRRNFQLRDLNDGSVTLLKLDSSGRTLTIGLAADLISTTINGSVLISAGSPNVPLIVRSIDNRSYIQIDDDATSGVIGVDNDAGNIIEISNFAGNLDFWIDFDDSSGHFKGAVVIATDLNITAGDIIMGGTGSDDEALQLPYLTQAPATLVNGKMWMEADGLHIYYNGAEKLVAGV